MQGQSSFTATTLSARALTMTPYAVLARALVHHINVQMTTCIEWMQVRFTAQMPIAQTLSTPIVVLKPAYAKVMLVLLSTSADL
mmetsp:Transcript_157789/g.279769  ORF Transcript_157789/g.279769 Transcript_157789/m.279769 type:complete len:84 (-) Transcript_157789:63-314(-)